MAPYIAAREEGIAIDLERVARTVEAGRCRAELTLVEGAGGWRVPVTEDDDMAALAVLLGLPVIVVARTTLGTINHSLLTIEAIERERCELAALVLSCRPEDDPELACINAAEVSAAWGGRVILLERDERALDLFHVEQS